MRQHMLERKMVMVEQATTLFATQGFDNTTMNQIAEQAGVGIATLFRYFPNKESLIMEVVKQVIEQKVPLFKSIVDKPISGYEKIKQVLEVYIAYIHGESTANIKLLEAFEVYASFNAMDEQLLQEINDAYGKIGDYLTEMFKEGQQDGSIKDEISLELLTSLLNLFGTAVKKYSLYEVLPRSIVSIPNNAQLLAIKDIALQYIKK